MTLKDITGQIFGRWKVTARSDNTALGQARWVCVCECGVVRVVYGSSLRAGTTKSCGCLNKENTTKARTTHGFTSGSKMHPIYSSWAGIKKRCDNKNTKCYAYYGGKGVSYDPKWANFDGFYEDMGNSWQEGLEIDRIDSNGNYCKENCRWATRTQQMNNTRFNLMLDYQGRTQSLADWCRELGMNYDRVNSRISHYHWSVDKAFTTP